jgi:hypothetical protein
MDSRRLVSGKVGSLEALGNIKAAGYFYSNGTAVTGGGSSTLGTISANLDMNGYSIVNAANLTVSGKIMPTVSNVQDIGSSTMRFGKLYLAGNTIVH